MWFLSFCWLKGLPKWFVLDGFLCLVNLPSKTSKLSNNYHRNCSVMWNKQFLWAKTMGKSFWQFHISISRKMQFSILLPNLWLSFNNSFSHDIFHIPNSYQFDLFLSILMAGDLKTQIIQELLEVAVQSCDGVLWCTFFLVHLLHCCVCLKYHRNSVEHHLIHFSVAGNFFVHLCFSVIAFWW